jgi:uncharacterized protein YndB with AHSA1/START domain
MVENTTSSETTLQIRRTFAASRGKVFQAWTTPEALEKWFAPSDEYTTKVLELDLCVGGRYRIEMRSPEGKIHCLVGAYREVKPPEKLVYTWSWEEGKKEFGETLVTVDFCDLGNATEIILTHEFFPTAGDRAEHEGGWAGCLNRLPKAL